MSELEFGVWNLTLGIENKTSEKAERFQNLILKIKLLKKSITLAFNIFCECNIFPILLKYFSLLNQQIMRSRIIQTKFYFLVYLLFWQCQSEPPVPGSAAHIQEVTSAIDAQALINAEATPENWLTHGGTYTEDRYSPLTAINKETVKDLGLAWSLDLGVMRGIEASPIVVDGIMYLTGPWSIVWAVDLRKGELLWKYDPEVDPNYGVCLLRCGE